MNVVVLNISVAGLVVMCAVAVFRRVARDYEKFGQLTSLSTSLEILIFVLQGVVSGLYLGTELASGWLWVLAVLCLVLGLTVLFVAMSGLGMRKSVGQDVSGLKDTGLYRYTRNPQIVAYGLAVIGFALLLPSWWGLVWIGLYAVIAGLMVQAEEAHLHHIYGEAYGHYCACVPRYVGLRR